MNAPTIKVTVVHDERPGQRITLEFPASNGERAANYAQSMRALGWWVSVDHGYPHKEGRGITWACCESSIGPSCAHMCEEDTPERGAAGLSALLVVTGGALVATIGPALVATLSALRAAGGAL